jgi:hypothetical protein
MKKELKVVEVGVAVFVCEGGNDVGEILLFVLLGSLTPAALIAFVVDLLILLLSSLLLVLAALVSPVLPLVIMLTPPALPPW